MKLRRLTPAAVCLLVCSVCCAAFITLCSLIMSYAGIENDEALFTESLYSPYSGGVFVLSVFHRKLPLMLMTYVGTLKTLLYEPVFRIFAPSVASIRLPPVILGAITIWLFFLLMLNIGGKRAAIAGTVLFSTDVMFIMTNTFDWGPVALQHVLLVGGLLALVRFHATGRTLLLGLGCFLFGLALWDKALFLWSLTGLGVAAILVYSRELVRHLSLRNVLVAIVCLMAGSLPLLIYNVRSHGGTLAGNASLSPGNIPGKAASLQNTLDGSGMLGYITFDPPAGVPRPPADAAERFSLWLNGVFGRQRRNYNEPLILAALLLFPFLSFTPARRPMLFALIFLAVTWIQMALTKNAGGSVHHVVLLWPFPFVFIGIAFAEASLRLRRFGAPALALVVALAVGQNLLVFNEYCAEFIRYGANSVWTDAMFTLKDRLKAYRSKDLYVVDWGLINPLRLLDRGSLKLNDLSFALLDVPDGSMGKMIIAEMANPENVFVDNTPGYQVFNDAHTHLAQIAQDGGFRRVPLETVTDRNGRPVYLIFCYRH